MMQKFHKAIYDTLRFVTDITDKLSITNIILFTYQNDDKEFAELLYTGNPEDFIKKLNKRYEHLQIEFGIKFHHSNIKDAYHQTIEKTKQLFDKKGYYKALFEGDEFAEVCYDVSKNHKKGTGIFSLI